jgi:hypothetical protein
MTDTQLFRLLDPDGKEIMNGPMSAIMERLPDTHDRNAALETRLQSVQRLKRLKPRNVSKMHEPVPRKSLPTQSPGSCRAGDDAGCEDDEEND